MTGIEGRPSPGGGVAEAIVAAIRERTDAAPVASIVLGSGLGDLLVAARDAAVDTSEVVEIPYRDLPGMPPPTVPGHAGKLWIGELGGRSAAVFRGRVHLYEGYGMSLASITSQVAALLGARAIVLTAAVGALDPALAAGSLVVIRDHVNLMGANPLAGWHMPDGSPAFVDLSDVYDAGLAEAALEAASTVAGIGAGGMSVAEGIYAAVTGPSYETPAEKRFLRRSGATVVGMSLVPEAVAARALGMRVLGLSFVTNAAGTSVSHEDVLSASQAASDVIGRVVVELVRTF